MKRLITIAYDMDDASVNAYESEILSHTLEVLNKAGAGEIQIQTGNQFGQEHEIQIPEFMKRRLRGIA